MDKSLQKTIENITGGTIFEESWESDILSSLADHIQEHNRFRQKSGEELEPKFVNLRKGLFPLAEVAKRDFNLLKVNVPILQQMEEHLAFLEVYGANPNAHTFPLEYNGNRKIYVALRTPLIYFIHSFFSKAFILMYDSRLCDCLPEHDKIMKSDKYSDQSLIAGIFNDIEIFFDKKRISNPIMPFHLGTPYDYCEFVEGARKFVIAHELSHWIIDPKQIERIAENSKGIMSAEWITEIQCDSAALEIIFANYSKERLTNTEFYELINAIKGVILFFYALDTVEMAFDNNYSSGFSYGEEVDTEMSHPPASTRVEFLYKWMNNHEVYTNNKELQTIIKRYVRRLNTFRRFLGGNGIPAIELDSYKSKMTPFGKEAFRRIFYRIASEGSHDLLPDY